MRACQTLVATKSLFLHYVTDIHYTALCLAHRLPQVSRCMEVYCVRYPSRYLAARCSNYAQVCLPVTLHMSCMAKHLSRSSPVYRPKQVAMQAAALQLADGMLDSCWWMLEKTAGCCCSAVQLGLCACWSLPSAPPQPQDPSRSYQSPALLGYNLQPCVPHQLLACTSCGPKLNSNYSFVDILHAKLSTGEGTVYRKAGHMIHEVASAFIHCCKGECHESWVSCHCRYIAEHVCEGLWASWYWPVGYS